MSIDANSICDPLSVEPVAELHGLEAFDLGLLLSADHDAYV